MQSITFVWSEGKQEEIVFEIYKLILTVIYFCMVQILSNYLKSDLMTSV